MAIYKDKWDIFDFRFLGVWFVVSNLSSFLGETVSFPKEQIGTWIAFIVGTVLFIPLILLIISEETWFKRYSTNFFYKFKWVYSLVGLTCLALAVGYFLFLLIKVIK